jgi:tetratricopeptide (TPR) repeat protein
MRAAQYLQRVIDAPPPWALGVACLVAVALVALACGLLAAGRWRRVAGVLGITGFVLILGGLFLVNAQTTRTQESESVTAIRARYTEGSRRLARLGLVALPAVVLGVTFAVLANRRRQRRRQVPNLLKAGRLHRIQKSYDTALQEYDRALRVAPYLADAHYGRGCVYQAMGKPAEALADFDRAIECDPQHGASYLERAKLRTDGGDFEQAFSDFNQLMLIRPNDPELYLHRGICLLKKGLVPDAVSDFHRVLKLTNHTDFAEPARNYLRQYGALPGAAGPSSEGNGAPGAPFLPRLKSEDQII